MDADAPVVIFGCVKGIAGKDKRVLTFGETCERHNDFVAAVNGNGHEFCRGNISGERVADGE